MAGASLNVLVGQNGILRKAQEAVMAYRESERQENKEYKKVEYQFAMENPDDYFKSNASINDKINFAREQLDVPVGYDDDSELFIWMPDVKKVRRI